jgi:hypothetical protein
MRIVSIQTSIKQTSTGKDPGPSPNTSKLCRVETFDVIMDYLMVQLSEPQFIDIPISFEVHQDLQDSFISLG